MAVAEGGAGAHFGLAPGDGQVAVRPRLWSGWATQSLGLEHSSFVEYWVFYAANDWIFVLLHYIYVDSDIIRWLGG